MDINLSSLLQLRLNVYLYKKLGWEVSSSYIFFLGRLYFLLNGTERRQIMEAVRAVFRNLQGGPFEKVLLKSVLKGILIHYYEKLFNAYSSADTLSHFMEFNIRSKYIKVLMNGISKGKGVLLVTGHFGGVEYLPAFLCHQKIPTTIIAKFSSEELRRKSFKKASLYGCKIIDAGNTANIMKAISQNLSENRVVITQCDEIEEWRPSRRHTITFLGKVVDLDRTIDILERRCQATVIFGIMRRKPRMKYELILILVDKMKKLHAHSLYMTTGQLVLKTLERFIYRNPEEWYQWKKLNSIEIFRRVSHKKTLPEDKPVVGKPAYDRI